MKTQFKKPKVSIVIVNYNNAKFLTKSINSALDQSYNSKEIIVVDDNSNDKSIEILEKFKKKLLKKIRIKITKNQLKLFCKKLI